MLLFVDNPPQMLDTAAFAMNTAYNNATRDTPYYLMLGHPNFHLADLKLYVSNQTRETFETTKCFLEDSEMKQENM